jgi:hypothetical protein
MVDVPRVLLGCVYGEELELVVVIQTRVRLQDHVRGNRRTQGLFIDGLEELAEVEVPRLQEHRRVVVEAARSLVEQLDAGEIETQAADRRRRAVHDLELQQRRTAAGELRAPAAG